MASERLARSAPALLRRILETPELVATVRALEPGALGRLIAHVGLEDAGELVALASTAQLERIFDEDLWRSPRPGEDERFDPRRFATWLEVMLEAGADAAARRLAELPDELLTLAVERHALVIDLDALALELSERDDDDAEQTEKALESGLYHELGQYRLIARRHDGWDALVAILTELDEQQHDLAERLLERCAFASARYIEDHGGLYDVLTSEEMLEADAAGAREERRAGVGFVAPSAAASLLRHARRTPLDELLAARARDPITRAFFREWSRPATAARAAAPEHDPAAAEDDRAAPAPSPDALVALLDRAGVLDGEAPRARALASGKTPHPEEPLKTALSSLSTRSPELHAERMQELGYLANVLVAASDRALRPFQAAEAALAVCELGLAQLGVARRAAADELVERLHADQLFLVGWRRLYDAAPPPALAPVARLLGGLR
jgi:hypothetical protein